MFSALIVLSVPCRSGLFIDPFLGDLESDGGEGCELAEGAPLGGRLGSGSRQIRLACVISETR